MTAGTKSLRLSVDEILATSWDRKLAKDLADERKIFTRRLSPPPKDLLLGQTTFAGPKGM